MNSETAFRTFKRLWQRAPLWRFCGMLAALLTLIVVVSFCRVPNHVSSSSTLPAVGQAAYVPPPSNDVSTSANTAAPSLASSPASASSVRQKAGVPVAAPHARTASLSLATPGNSSQAASDLDSALGGRNYNGSITVDGYKVALPAGRWIILASAHYKSPHATGELVFLGQVKNRRLVGGARVTALHTVNPPVAGFPPKLHGCSGPNLVNLYVASEAMDADGHQSCWLINSFFTPPLQQWADKAIKIDPLDRAAGGDLTAKGVTYPQDFVRIRMTRTEAWGLLEVAYLFSPDASGIKSHDAISAADTDWARGNISQYPEKLAYIEKMKQWAAQFWPDFKSGFSMGTPK